MPITFARIEERRNTGNMKWDLQGPLPFGIADMDIESPPCVIDALKARVDHHFYGYAFLTDHMKEAIVSYLKARHGVEAQPEWLHELPGCVPAFTLVARAICGDSHGAIMTCSPVYPPMLHCHEAAGARLIDVPHVWKDGYAYFDWEAMEKAVTPDTKLFLLCNPHNPSGRCWSLEDLQRVGEFCVKHDLVLCSDEIHCDLVLEPGMKHTSALTLSPEIQERLVMLSAPSKTFNIAGICFSYMCVPNAKLKERIEIAQGCSLPTLNVFAYAAAEAAYRQGWGWHAELLETLRANRDFVVNYITNQIPQIKVVPNQATYLAWLDCSALGVESPHKFFREKAGVYLDDGANFGDPTHVRMNFATSQDQLRQGLVAMKKAVEELLG